jgi:hypothetical protein
MHLCVSARDMAKVVFTTSMQQLETPRLKKEVVTKGAIGDSCSTWASDFTMLARR